MISPSAYAAMSRVSCERKQFTAQLCTFVGLILGFVLFGTTDGRAQSVEVVARIPGGGAHFGPLLFAEDGRIFGTAAVGGARKEGMLFVIEKGGQVKTLIDFDHRTGGAFPFGPIVRAPDGSILGATVQGGDNSAGSIYKVAADGAQKTLVSFPALGPRNPYGGLVPSRERAGVYYGSTFASTALGKGTLFEVTSEGQIRYLSNEVYQPFGPILVTPDDQLYGTTYSGGNIPVAPKVIMCEGSIFTSKSGLAPKKIVEIHFGGYGGNGDICGLGLDPSSAMQQRLVMKDENSFLFVNRMGGKFSEGCLYALTSGGKLKGLRDFQKTASLGGPITEIVVANNGSVYCAMGPTQIYSTRGNKVTKTPLKGVICQIVENGELKIVWALDNGGPFESLAWNDGAIYGFQGSTLYRLVLNP